MNQEFPSYATFDTCVNAFIPLNCDGTVNELLEPLLFCGLTEATIRETVDDIAEITVEGQQSNRNCLERKATTERSDCFLDLTTCGVEHPLLWNWMKLYDLVTDVDGNICGFEPFSVEESCSTCSKAGTAACRHSLALISIRQAWCGDAPHPDYPYVAIIHPSLEFEPQENEITYGSGFNSSRSFTATLSANSNFIDPYGIVTVDDPIDRKFRNKLIQCPEGSAIEALVNTACSCQNCEAVAAV